MGSDIKRAIISLLLPVALLVVLPFIFSRYYLDLSIVFLINLILASSFRLISTTGDFSLAHVPLMGMGAYTSAIMSKQLGLPFFITLPLAGIVATIVGLVIGVLVLLLVISLPSAHLVE